MSLGDAVLLLFSVAGGTFLLGASTLLQRPREWLTSRAGIPGVYFRGLLGCAFCLGVNVGAAHGAAVWAADALPSLAPIWVTVQVALAGGAVALAYDRAVEALEVAVSGPAEGRPGGQPPGFSSPCDGVPVEAPSERGVR